MESGGFFFLDKKEGIYSPMALSGLDKTSAHRLRFPPELLQERCGGKPALIEGAGLSDFRMFLSSSEYRRLGSMRLIPLAFGQDDTAYLISLESQGNARQAVVPDEWNTLNAFLCERLSIHASRFSQGSGITDKSLSESKAGLFSLIGSAKHGGQRSVFVIFSLSPLMQAVQAKTPQADVFRLFTEACATLSRMFASPESLVVLPRQRIGVLLSSQVKPDPELILHQMAGSLQRLFSKLERFSLIPERVIEANPPATALDDFFAEEIRAS
jgi:hypothetical protein